VTARVGTTNTWDRQGELAARPLLSWADGRRMLAAGMTLGAHTRTHPALPDLMPEQARRELEDAREDFARELGITPALFAYPFGRFDTSTPEAVERAGYAGACCSRSGVNDPAVSPFLLRRLEVRGTDSLFRFALGVHRGRARRRRAAT
jgi:peptidoglycan/xylan/chitin deacetylase (PgdA/CDA1 family)